MFDKPYSTLDVAFSFVVHVIVASSAFGVQLDTELITGAVVSHVGQAAVVNVQSVHSHKFQLLSFDKTLK